MPWQALTYVTSGFTLVAFIVAAAVWGYRAWLRQRVALILGAPEKDRARLVESTLEYLQLDTASLTAEQRFELAVRQIDSRAKAQKRNAGIVIVVAVLSATISIVALQQGGTPAQASYKPRLEMASGVTVNGVAKKLQLIQRLQENTEQEAEVLTIVRVLEQFMASSAKLGRKYESRVLAYESLAFQQDTAEFVATSNSFRHQALLGTQKSAFLVRSGRPEVLRLDISKNEELTLHVPAAGRGDYVMVLLWVWAEKGSVQSPANIQFSVE